MSDIDRPALNALARSVRYGGNPEHKSDPGDFDLTPPATPRPDKTLCDLAGVKRRQVAVSLPRAGITKGLISRQERNGFPTDRTCRSATK